MVERPRLPYLLGGGAILFVALYAGLGLILQSRTDSPEAQEQIRVALAAAFTVSVVLLAACLAALERFLFSPLKQLEREIRILGVHPGHSIELPGHHVLGDIPQAIHDLGARLSHSKRVISEAVAISSSDLESRQTRLESILSSLQEGILVCDDRARVVFYNPAAQGIFHDNPALGVGHSLYLLVPSAPIENSLQILRHRRVRHQESENDISFVCATLQGGLMNCRIRLLPDLLEPSWSFLLTCEDISRDAEAAGRRESLLRNTVKAMRPPLTGLSLNAESLEMIDDLDAARRAELERSLADDARRLVAQFEILARVSEELESPRYVAREVFTEDLVAGVAQRLEPQGVAITLIGAPLWVKADVHALLYILEFLAMGIRRFTGTRAIEIEPLLGDRRVYFTYCWKGDAIPQSEVQKWMALTAEPLGESSIAEVLERLGSEVWSRRHEAPEFATLTLPIPSAPGRWGAPPPILPGRPVYVERPAPGEITDAGHWNSLPIETARFVVFDTETTGLAPTSGDQIVSLAGIKIIGRGIVLGETFNQVVDPGRPIPPESTRFHGITDDQVRGKPRIESALRAFHAFVGDSVLVGHNAAFDLRFIRLREQAAGVRFQGPVLDTLSLSRFLHDHTPAHSLDAIARRLGVEVRDRHTAMGDALITSEIFLKFLYLLQERGVITLGQALEISGR